MTLGSRKREHQKVVRTTITLTPVLFDASQELIRHGGYTGLSDLVQDVLRKKAGIGFTDEAPLDEHQAHDDHHTGNALRRG